MPKDSKPSSLLATLGLLGLAVGLGAIYHAWSRWRLLDPRVPEFLALALAAGALYLAGVWLVERFRLGPVALVVILAGAVAFRLFLLPLAPSLSSDTYRYQWEGRVQRLHLDPYTVYPALPELRWLQEPTHPLETGSTVSTLYPPLSEMAFAWVTTIAGYKRLFTGLDLACVAVLLALLASAGQPLGRVLVYAWNPTVVVSFALSGHHDSLAILTLLAANLFIIRRKEILANIFLAFSFLSKFYPILLLPFFLRGSRRSTWTKALAFASVAGLGYLPFLSAGPHLVHGLADYAAGWEGNDSLFRLIRLAGNSKGQAELVAGVLVLGLVLYAARKRLEPLSASLLVISGLLFLSPNAFPWYFTWMIPFLCFRPGPPLLLMSVTCVLGYAPVVVYAAGQPYRDSPLILVLEYVPVLVWLVYEACRATKAGN